MIELRSLCNKQPCKLPTKTHPAGANPSLSAAATQLQPQRYQPAKFLQRYNEVDPYLWHQQWHRLSDCPHVLHCFRKELSQYFRSDSRFTRFPARVTSLREPLMPHTGVIPHPLTCAAIAGVAHIIVHGPEHTGNPFFKVPPIKVTSKRKTAVGASVSHAGPASPAGRRGRRSRNACSDVSARRENYQSVWRRHFSSREGRMEGR